MLQKKIFTNPVVILSFIGWCKTGVDFNEDGLSTTGNLATGRPCKELQKKVNYGFFNRKYMYFVETISRYKSKI